MIKSYPQHYLNNLHPFLHSSSFSFIFFIIPSFTSRIIQALASPLCLFHFLSFLFFSFFYFFTVSPWVILPYQSNHVPVLLNFTSSSQPSLVVLSLRSRPVAFCISTLTSIHQEQQELQLLQLTHISLAVIIWNDHSINNSHLLTIQMISPVFH